MSSLLTNSSAMNALTTLKSINRDLDITTNRISTGQRVSSAADNAAYWSIATTVRSDNKSLSAVKDALGLGSATVDTTYNGMSSIIEDMKNLRSKLTTALAPNVDRAKVQTEIAAIQSKMKATADSSVMSGQNWLSVDSGNTAVYKPVQTVVGGFSRDTNGNISFSNISINVDSIKLYDVNGSNGTPATEARFSAGVALSGTMDFTSGVVDFTLDVDGTSANIVLNNASMASAANDLSAVTTGELLTAINNQIAASSLNGEVTASYDNQGRLTFQTTATGSTTLSLTINTGTDIDVGFGTTASTTVSATGTVAVSPTVKGILDTNFSGRTYSVATLNIASLSGAAGDLELQSIITNVDKALASMTDAATKLGASKTQIEGQTAFVDSLMKANEKTIGTLVDADMEEESARLKALQVQQQLGVQSLSIANSASQNILSLFR